STMKPTKGVASDPPTPHEASPQPRNRSGARRRFSIASRPAPTARAPQTTATPSRESERRRMASPPEARKSRKHTNDRAALRLVETRSFTAQPPDQASRRGRQSLGSGGSGTRQGGVFQSHSDLLREHGRASPGTGDPIPARPPTQP